MIPQGAEWTLYYWAWEIIFLTQLIFNIYIAYQVTTKKYKGKNWLHEKTENDKM